MTKLVDIKMLGALGKGLRLSCDNRLKKVNYQFMVGPFKDRSEVDNAWRCEFWGKVTRSAILTNYWLKDEELAVKIKDAVQAIMATQDASGCISSYPAELQLDGWDVWGRKYVLLGLMRYYRLVEQDPAVLKCCCGMVDHLMTQVGPELRDLRECGRHAGLAPCSILVAIVELYNLTGEQRYLDFAQWIADLGCSLESNIYESAAAGVAPAAIGNAKSYELTSCFEGLADLYKIVPKPIYRDACIKYFNAVREREIFITGVSGLKDRVGEFWYDGALRQTLPGCGGRGETCITATWLHYCLKMMEMMPDSTVPLDEAERTLYNGMLGAMKPDGSDWCHLNPTPLTGGGVKLPAPDQINKCAGTPFDNHDCCRAQGPEGLACAPYFAISSDVSGAVKLNLFESMIATFDNGAQLEVTGNYPYGPEAHVKFTAPAETVLKVRIPEYCTGVECGGKAVGFLPKSYLSFAGSVELTLKFDVSLKEVEAPGDPSYIAVKRGAVVLAEDSRGEVPTAAVNETWRGHKLVDYVAAGGEFNESNTLKVWFKR